MNYEQIMAYTKDKMTEEVKKDFSRREASEDSPTSLSEQV